MAPTIVERSALSDVAIKSAFHLLDSDNDGLLQRRSELPLALRALSLDAPPVSQLRSTAQHEGGQWDKKYMNYPEFVALVTDLLQTRTSEPQQLAQEEMADGDGNNIFCAASGKQFAHESVGRTLFRRIMARVAKIFDVWSVTKQLGSGTGGASARAMKMLSHHRDADHCDADSTLQLAFRSLGFGDFDITRLIDTNRSICNARDVDDSFQCDIETFQQLVRSAMFETINIGICRRYLAATGHASEYFTQLLRDKHSEDDGLRFIGVILWWLVQNGDRSEERCKSLCLTMAEEIREEWRHVTKRHGSAETAQGDAAILVPVEGPTDSRCISCCSSPSICVLGVSIPTPRHSINACISAARADPISRHCITSDNPAEDASNPQRFNTHLTPTTAATMMIQDDCKKQLHISNMGACTTSVLPNAPTQNIVGTDRTTIGTPSREISTSNPFAGAGNPSLSSASSNVVIPRLKLSQVSASSNERSTATTLAASHRSGSVYTTHTAHTARIDSSSASSFVVMSSASAATHRLFPSALPYSVGSERITTTHNTSSSQHSPPATLSPSHPRSTQSTSSNPVTLTPENWTTERHSCATKPNRFLADYYRPRVKRYYDKYCPHKTSADIDQELADYAGNEFDLMMKLAKKYGPTP